MEIMSDSVSMLKYSRALSAVKELTVKISKEH
jgi:hypothetical protein